MIRDIVAISGVVCIVGGAYLHSPAVALLVAGVFLFAIGIIWGWIHAN